MDFQNSSNAGDPEEWLHLCAAITARSHEPGFTVTVTPGTGKAETRIPSEGVSSFIQFYSSHPTQKFEKNMVVHSYMHLQAKLSGMELLVLLLLVLCKAPARLRCLSHANTAGPVLSMGLLMGCPTAKWAATASSHLSGGDYHPLQYSSSGGSFHLPPPWVRHLESRRLKTFKQWNEKSPTENKTFTKPTKLAGGKNECMGNWVGRLDKHLGPGPLQSSWKQKGEKAILQEGQLNLEVNEYILTLHVPKCASYLWNED